MAEQLRRDRDELASGRQDGWTEALLRQRIADAETAGYDPDQLDPDGARFRALRQRILDDLDATERRARRFHLLLGIVIMAVAAVGVVAGTVYLLGLAFR